MGWRVLESILVLLALTVFTGVPILVYLKQRKQAFQYILMTAGFGAAWLGRLIDCFVADPDDGPISHILFMLGMGAAAFAFLGMFWLEIREQVAELAGKIGIGPQASASTATPTPPPPTTPPPPPTTPPPPPTVGPEALPPMDLPPVEAEDDPKPQPPPPPPG